MELVMPDLLGALGIVIFVSYRLVQNHNTSACQNRFWWSFILFFRITMPISVYFFWENKLQIELQNCTAGIPAPTGFSRRTVLYLWYKKKGGTSMKRNIKKTAVAFFAAADRKVNLAAAITDRKKPAENMDAVFK